MKLSDLARAVGLAPPDRDIDISRANTLAKASADELGFLANARYRSDLDTTQAGAILIQKKYADRVPDSTIAIICDEPYQIFAGMMQHLFPRVSPAPGIAPTAVISESASIEQSCEVGPGSTIGDATTIGADTIIGANCTIGKNASIGTGCLIYGNVSIYDGVCIGNNCIVHSGAVIGSDGFGFAPSPTGAVKIPQVAGVFIGNDVEIGANTTIDRGALSATVIGDGVKLDNQIQVGHNVEIGPHTMIAAQVGIAGSTIIGAGCLIGGQAAFSGHMTVGDGCQIAAKAGVMRDLEPGSVVGGVPAVPQRHFLRMIAATQKLPDLIRNIPKNPEDKPVS